MLTPKIYILSACSVFLDQADNFFLPCPFKYLTGIDCPGCGFQRSVVALLKGDLSASLHFYPPTIPLLLTLAIVLTAKFRRWELQDLTVKALYVTAGSTVLISYMFKMTDHYFPTWLHSFH